MQDLADKYDVPQQPVVPFPAQAYPAMFKKEAGYTKMPNLLMDGQIMASLNDKSFKCLMFILRQTIGFGRSSHSIAMTQFQKYCGIKKRDTVISAIHELEQVKLICVARKTGCLNRYMPTLDQYQQQGQVTTQGAPPIDADGTAPDKEDGSSTVTQDTIKENLKENLKETFKKKNKPSVAMPFQSHKQNRGSLNFIDYHAEDQQFYTLKELSDRYPIKNDFLAQAALSAPHLSEVVLLEQLDALAQWSVGQTPRPAQKWLSTWFNWLKNYQACKPKSKTRHNISQKTPSTLHVNDAWQNQAVHHSVVENLHVDIPEDFI